MTQKTKILTALGLLIVAIVAGATGLKIGFAWLMKDSNDTIVATKSGLNQEETTKIVNATFIEFNLPVPELGNNSLSVSEDDSLGNIRAHLLERNIEMYELTNGTKRTWRIYNRLGLQYEIVWTGTQAPSAMVTDTPTKFPKTTDGTVALILSGTDNKNLEPLINLSTPINFALTPNNPFTLRNAVHAAHNWHEVLLDIRSLDEIEFDAVPFATALLSDEPFPMSSLPAHQINNLHQVYLDGSNTVWTVDASERIWLLDISQHPVLTVKDWIEKLPKNIRLVRLSHWDIVSL